MLKYSAGNADFRMPYLPDALAKTAVLRLDFDPKDLPTVRVEVPYYDGAPWPDALPFKIHLFEDAAAVIHYDLVTRTVHVPLAKADVMRVRISHALSKNDLELMAIWDLMKQRPGMTAALGGSTLRYDAQRGTLDVDTLAGNGTSARRAEAAGATAVPVATGETSPAQYHRHDQLPQSHPCEEYRQSRANGSLV